MVEHPIEHEVVTSPYVRYILPGSQFWVDAPKVGDRKSSIGRVGEEGKDVQGIDRTLIVSVNEFAQYGKGGGAFTMDHIPVGD